MSTQSTLTVTGFVGSSVRFSVGKEGGVPYASFRLGSTQRIYDRAAQAFKDTPTQWYTVKVWRHVATNVVQSLRKGEPVVVTGRLRTEEWVSPEGPRTSVVIEASALGHDLTFGTAKFERTLAPGARGAAADEASGESPAVDVSALPEAPEGGDEPDLGEDDLDDLDEIGALREGTEHDEALVG
jgi:single-strand DNA-binding protein